MTPRLNVLSEGYIGTRMPHIELGSAGCRGGSPLSPVAAALSWMALGGKLDTNVA